MALFYLFEKQAPNELFVVTCGLRVERLKEKVKKTKATETWERCLGPRPLTIQPDGSCY
jgi:hypothetical protein